MVITSAAEFLTISLLSPLIVILTNPLGNIDNKIIISIQEALNLSNEKNLQIYLAVIFLSLTILSGILKIFNLGNYFYFSQSIGKDLSETAFSNLLYQDYSYHINKNSSEAISAIINFSDKTVFYIKSILNILSSIILASGIIIALLFINFKFTLFTLIFLLITYSLLFVYTKKRISVNSKKMASITDLQIRILQEAVSSIKDIIIGRHQLYLINKFTYKEKEKRLADFECEFLGASPKFAVEAIGITIIISIALISFSSTNNSSDIKNTLPLIGVITLGCQRLLPILQLGYASISSLRQDKEAVINLLRIVFLNKKNQGLSVSSNKKNLKSLNKNILLKNISYQYNHDSDFIINNFNYEILKGDSIAITGKTGSGKSTLLNLILGLIQPKKGEIYMDGKLYNSPQISKSFLNISHVPQVINLNDTSIKENIAYGIPKDNIDNNLVRKCAEIALIDDFIESLNNKYDHIIGEKGIKISGGQRQRIGIARALYKKADILVLDEATNALDQKTEYRILKSLMSLDKKLTIIMVTHRLSILNFFDKVIKL